MKKQQTSAARLLKSLALLSPLAGCAQTETPLPGTSKLLDELPRVQNSTKAPCWMQEQVAAQNSYVDSIKAKKEVVYQAPCKVDQPKIAEARK
ncbi:MAG: hypothetical protein IPK59_23305 [Rhodospirillaceae bacterium]|nr:hypothetical protein [Rhodospirillaceae bacterium]